MIKTAIKSLFAAAILFSASASAQAQQQDPPAREHRGLWMTPFLSSNWPSGAITELNAESHKRILTTRLDKFKDQNINVLYYHVRAMCDAMYDSAYEPWSSSASGKRGQAPAFDPFGFLIQEAHARGLEVYAWVNPYRYCGAVNGYGASNPMEYENAHPDWLIRQDHEWILNPCLPEVRQRICDVVKDIMNKYDVDGIVFDDYFYSNPTPLTLDAAQFNAYRAAGGTIADQNSWRRNNVNMMVEDVYRTVKSIKPYCVFGIAPAGVSSPPNIESEYGFKGPGVSGDWQYNAIASDPLNWVKNHNLDFIGPQLYWPDLYRALSSWWAMATGKFERHLYPAITLSSVTDYKNQEFIDEVLFTRSVLPQDVAGLSYFEYNKFVNYTENLFGTRQSFGENMRDGAYQSKALTPLRAWNNVYAPAMTANVSRSGNTLTWDAVDGMRYTVYAIPTSVADAQFAQQREYLDGIAYTNSYTIPAAKADGYRWAVAVYDRYGNEYSALAEGAKQASTAPAQLVYPADGGRAVDLFDFQWTGNGGRYTVQVANDADFSDIVGWLETAENKVSVNHLPQLKTGNTYYWRVISSSINAPVAVSVVRSFIASRLAITSPAPAATGVSYTPTVTWDKCADGTEYVLEISGREDFVTIDYTITTTANSVAVPNYKLKSGRTYYARVTASKEGASSQSETISFKTIDRSDYAAPSIVNPAADGATVHCNEGIGLSAWEGMNGVEVYIAASTSFPTRTSYKVLLSDFETATKPLEDVKISSKSLENGATYYVRVRGAYTLTTTSTTQYTEYSPTLSFVYSSEAGVQDILAGAEKAVYVDAENILHLDSYNARVEVFSVAGQAVMSQVAASDKVDLSSLASGAYVIRTVSPVGVKTIKWIK